MRQVQLKTTKIHRFNKTCLMGGRSVTFDHLGATIVNEDCVEELLQRGLEVVSEEDKKRFKETADKIARAKTSSGSEGLMIDTFDENNRLKEENFKLKKENESLLKENEELKSQIPVVEEEVEKDSDIDKMSLKELRNTCKQVGLPEKDWKSLKTKELKSYLKAI